MTLKFVAEAVHAAGFRTWQDEGFTYTRPYLGSQPKACPQHMVCQTSYRRSRVGTLSLAHGKSWKAHKDMRANADLHGVQAPTKLQHTFRIYCMRARERLG